MRAAVAALVLLAGCEPLKVYLHETEGISPVQLLPLYQQEKQYVADRELEAKVRGVLGPDAGVEVYLGEVTLKDASQAGLARSVRGVKSVKVE